MSVANIFERGTRANLLFSNTDGRTLSIADLWRAKPQTLDAIAIQLNSELEATPKIASFRANAAAANSKITAAAEEVKLKLEIVLYVLKTLDDEAAARNNASAAAETVKTLEDLLHRRRANTLEGLTEDEIIAKIAAARASAAGA